MSLILPCSRHLAQRAARWSPTCLRLQTSPRSESFCPNPQLFVCIRSSGLPSQWVGMSPSSGALFSRARWLSALRQVQPLALSVCGMAQGSNYSESKKQQPKDLRCSPLRVQWMLLGAIWCSASGTSTSEDETTAYRIRKIRPDHPVCGRSKQPWFFLSFFSLHFRHIRDTTC